jgi:hypothetical protein
MKTKFVLHGGFTPGEKQENDALLLLPEYRVKVFYGE